MRTLHLTQDQFDALYDLLEDKLNDIQSHLDEDIGDVTLDDYEIYHVWKQLDRTISEPKVTLTPEDNDPVIINLPEGTNLTRVIRSDDDYADKVDTFVGNMVASDDNVFTHDSEGC